MTEVVVSKTIEAKAKEVWERLASFRGIEDFSPIEKSITNGEGAGATRTCYLPDGAAIHEVLETVNPGEMQMIYSITEGPFPITGYVSTVKVSEVSETMTTVTWGAVFETSVEAEKEMIALFEGFYNVIIDSLEGVLA